jgi:hypothetical protein
VAKAAAVEKIRRKLLAESYTAHGVDLEAQFRRMDRVCEALA